MRAIPTRFCGFLILSVYLAGCNSGYKPKPVISAALQISISATSAAAGSPDFTLTIASSFGQFYNTADNLSQAVWLVNGSDNVLSTTFVSNSMLTAVIPAAFLSNPVKAQVFERQYATKSKKIFERVCKEHIGVEIESAEMIDR